MPKKGVMVPIRLKIVGLISISLASSLAAYLYVGSTLIVEDKASYIYDYNLAQIKAGATNLELQMQRMTTLRQQLTETVAAKGTLTQESLATTYTSLAKTIKLLRIVIAKPVEEGRLQPALEAGGTRFTTEKLLAQTGWNLAALTSEQWTVKMLEGGTLALGAKLSATSDVAVLCALEIDGAGFEDGVGEFQVLVYDAANRWHLLKPPAKAEDAATGSGVSDLAKSLEGSKFGLGVTDAKIGEVPFMVSYKRIETGGLLVVGLIPKSVAFSGAKVLVRRSLVIGVSILIIAIGITLIFARSITDRIKQMWQATERVSEGDFTFRVDPGNSSRDEILDLAMSFNAMASKIEELMEEVAEKVRIEKELEKKAAIQMILDNLDEGFMTFNSEGTIQEGVSKAAVEFFGNEIQGRAVSDVLRLPAEKSADVKEWVKILFEQALPFQDLKELGPKIYGGMPDRYIEIDYRAVFAADQTTMERVILVARDKTVERTLRAKAETEAELVKFVVGILRDRSSFVTYVNDTRRNLIGLTTETAKPLEQIDLQLLFRLMHSVKGSSASFNVLPVSRIAHTLEDALAKISQSGNRKELEALMPAVLQGIYDITNTFEDFLKKHRHITGPLDKTVGRERTFPVARLREGEVVLREKLGADAAIARWFHENYVLERLDEVFGRFEATVTQVAELQKKGVNFIITPTELRVDTDVCAPLLEAMVHAFRNAVDHGIESRDERKAKNKSEQGRIRVSFDRAGPDGSYLRWNIEDDGRGINPEIIAKVALARKVVDSERLAQMKPEEIMQLVFAPGFSSKNEVTETSGRGVGLDAIKDAATALGGVTWVESAIGIGTRLVVVIPSHAIPKQSAAA